MNCGNIIWFYSFTLFSYSTFHAKSVQRMRPISAETAMHLPLGESTSGYRHTNWQALTHSTLLKASNGAARGYARAAQQPLGTQTPIPWPPMLLPSYFASGFFPRESFHDAVVGAVCSNDHSPWAAGRRQPGWETFVLLAPCGCIFCGIAVS